MAATSVGDSLTEAQKTDLINLGLLMGYVAFPDSNMTAAVHGVLSSPDLLANLSVSLEPVVGPHLNESLLTLAAWLEEVPHDNTVLSLTVSLAVMAFVATVAVSLRVYSRRKVTGKLWAEDWWAIAALVCSLGTLVPFEGTVHIGIGARHIWDVTHNQIKVWLLWVHVATMLFTITLVPVKFTYAVFYYRLSPDKWYRVAIIAVMIVIFLTSFTGIIVEIFQCKPLDYWNHMMEGPKCIDRPLFFMIWGYMTVAADIILLLLPIWKVSTLNIRKRREKILVLGMFAAGGLICIANVLRVIAFNKTFIHYDSSYDMEPVGRWGILELDLAIILSCLPALKHLFLGTKSTSISLLASRIVRSLRNPRRMMGGISQPTAPTTTPFSSDNIDHVAGYLSTKSGSDTKATRSSSRKDEEDGLGVRSYVLAKDSVDVSEKEKGDENEAMSRR